jgi:hypothetical protein
VGVSVLCIRRAVLNGAESSSERRRTSGSARRTSAVADGGTRPKVRMVGLRCPLCAKTPLHQRAVERAYRRRVSEPCPDDARACPAWKDAEVGEAGFKRRVRRRNPAHGGLRLPPLGVCAVAEKDECQVKRLRPHPADIGEGLAERFKNVGGEAPSHLLRRVKGYEKAHQNASKVVEQPDGQLGDGNRYQTESDAFATHA